MLNLIKYDDGSFWIDLEVDTMSPSNVITNQSEKSITVNINGVDYQFYNSAVLLYKEGGYWQAFIVLIVNTTGRIQKNSSSWGVLDSYDLSANYGNNCYSRAASLWTELPNASNKFYTINLGGYGEWFEATSDLPIFDNVADFYNFVQNPYAQYQWTSVPAINGKMGILSLSRIKDSEIRTGDYVSAADSDAFSRLVYASSLDELLVNTPNNTEVKVAYAGMTKYMTLERTAPIKTYVIRLYEFGFSGAQYTYTYSPGSNVTSYISFIRDHENEVAALSIIGKYVTDNYKYSYNSPGASTGAEDMHYIYNWLLGHVVSDDVPPLDSLVDNEGDGGGFLQDRENNPIPKPDVPYLSAYDSGFVSQYQITKAELKKLCSYLWSNDFVSNVKKFFNDPREIIMGISIFPLVPTTGEPKTIKAGGITTPAEGYPITNQFERYEFGSVKIKKRLVNMDGDETDDEDGIYFDYSPFTSIKVYIPYCGEHDLTPDDVLGKTLKLDYTVDHLSGMCCAHLTIIDPENDRPDECHYNFTGQMGVQIPLSSEDYGGFYRAMLSSGAAVGSTIATIATGGMTAPLAVSAAANAIGNVANMGKDVQYTSGGGSISGSLGSNYPYVTITEPNVFMADNQAHYTGYPMFATTKLKKLKGYTEVMSIHLDGLSCTESEREIIRTQLSNGVVIQTGDELPTPSAGDELGKIMLLTNLSDVDTIGKTFAKDNNDQVAYIEIDSDLIYNQNFTRVGLLINQFDATCNYVYIPTFGRCYYVDSVTAESGSMCRLDLVEDASESFWNELKECKALIKSNEELSNAKLLVNNNTWFMKQKRNVKTLTFKNDDGSTAKFDRAANGSERFLITIAGDTND